MPADGVYKITNVAFAGDNLVADLYGGFQFGAITTYVSYGGPFQRWRFTNVSNGQVIIQNVSSGTYAAAYSETEGAGVVGSANPTLWTLKHVSGDQYYITTANGNLTWYINKGSENSVINLASVSSAGPRGQWSLTPA